MEYSIKSNSSIENKKIEIPGDFELECEFIYEADKKDFVPHYFAKGVKTIETEKLEPSEFKIYKIKR